ncbi:MAG: hypothetical protein DRN40_03780 [Thermoplasmata archaeon]|nr:MAG: hypothetical protein DRN28_02530 [Thermoplasmata archaeon]RLF70815.1 MAG: hypothetical protein DRN40_03780 [Thermoplasmata archaeon]
MIMSRKLLFILVPLLLLIPPTVHAQEETVQVAEWTILVYMVADNNLESAGIEDVNEMEQVGSTEEVNIVVQMDRHKEYDTSNGDWTGTKRFYITQDSDTETITSVEVEDLNETNMGTQKALVSFVSWGVENYPAKRYMLILWDHGGSFWGVCYDEDDGEGDKDYINMSELKGAMEEVYGIVGRRIDILGFDACLMAETSVLYQVRDLSEIVLASGYSEPNDGWPYKEILEKLVQRPTMGGEDLAKIVVDEYVRSYTDRMDDPQDSPAVTMTAFNMRAYPKAAEAISHLAMELSTQVTLRSLQIWTARTRTTGYDLANIGPFDVTNYPLYDVVDFCDKLQQYIPFDNRIHDVIDEVKGAVAEAVIYAKADPYHPGAHGLTIYFPNRENPEGPVATVYDPLYSRLDFGREKFWDDFLKAYYNLKDIRDPPPTVTILSPQWNQSFQQPSNIVLSGEAFDLKEVRNVSVRVDGGKWVEIPGVRGPGTITWRYVISTENLPPGRHLLEVKATDSAGQSSPVVSTWVCVISPPKEREASGGLGTEISLLLIIFVAALITGAALLLKKR